MLRIFATAAVVLLAPPAIAAPYALLNAAGDRVVEIREWEKVPPDLGASGTPNQYWVAYETVDPAFDSKTQVRTGPVRAILADRVTDTWTVRNKTSQELAAEAEVRKDDAMTAVEGVDNFERAFVMVLIEELNRHAAATQAIKDAAAGASTLAQFKAAMANVQIPPTRSFSDLRTAIRNKLGQ